ncbi:FRG domain-containing protein [Agrobacterium sp. O3.4]|uniref:FRG domain-containing protein n=1 Tax=Agrobacterium cucumeris TaxID=2862866 RepID=A0ABY8RGZ3_9HYPH|nr:MULTISPECIES: FRG domain-containing protein [Rhizobium/Agrobacterium group]MCZ7469798.1 FRG domain-containing protein [Rhizobium rhizogenes]WHO06951.1 FRG domain-containing protein [Agrobacterium cucumeris]
MSVIIKKKIKNITEVSNLQEFFAYLASDKPKKSRVNLFRGHALQSYFLQPSLFRKKEYRRDEKNIVRELISIQPNEFRDDRTMFEQLVRMQHFSLPTRLLDVTYNPLVALYFTCVHHQNQDGDLIRLSAHQTEIKYFDSDTVSCVANLANLSGKQRDEIRRMSGSEEIVGSDVGERLLHFIQAEKPYFRPRIQIDDLKDIIVVKPKQTNRRILAQQGAFLIFGLKTILHEDNDFAIDIRKIKIPAASKKHILSELDGININSSTLFPEIESAAKYIMSKVIPVEDGFEQLE